MKAVYVFLPHEGEADEVIHDVEQTTQDGATFTVWESDGTKTIFPLCNVGMIRIFDTDTISEDWDDE